MEYAISILITLIFIIVYLLVKAKEREHFTKTLTDDEFVLAIKNLAKDDCLPNKNGKKEYSINMFLRKIKFVNYITKRHLDVEKLRSRKLIIPELQTFCDIVEENFSFLKNSPVLIFILIYDNDW